MSAALIPAPLTDHPRRQPLGLPAGSVRALLTFMVLGLVWALMCLPPDRRIPIPLYLFYLMFLVLGHFFAAHGNSIAGPTAGRASPLYLPRGTLRTLIVLGFLGALGWRYYQRQDLNELFKLEQPLAEQPFLPVVLVLAFIGGVFFTRVLGRAVSGTEGPAPWFQDILAWVALLATIGLAAEVVIQLIINPTLDPDRRLNLPGWQAWLAAVTTFYFGARS